VLKLVWQPDGRRLTSAAADGSIKVWELSAGGVRGTVPTGEDEITEFAFSLDGKWLAVEGQAKIRLLNRATGKVERDFPIKRAGEKRLFLRKQLLFRDDSRKLAVLSSDGVHYLVTVHDVLRGKQEAELEFEEAPLSAAFGPDGHLLLVILRKDLTVWDVDANRSIWQIPFDVAFVGYLSPNGQLLVTSESLFSSIILWDLAKKAKVADLSRPGGPFVPSSPEFSRDGRSLTLSSISFGRSGKPEAGRAGGVTLLGLPALERRSEIPGEPILLPLAFSHDSRLLALLNPSDLSIAFWHVESGMELFRWRLDSRAKESNRCDFTPEGDFALCQPHSSDLHILRVDELRRQLAEIGLGW